MSFFRGQNFRFFARKSVLCYRAPDFVNGAFVALGDTFDLAPSDLFFDFSFPSYSRFCEGDPPMRQKVFPHPTTALWGLRLPVTALAGSARGLDKFLTGAISQFLRCLISSLIVWVSLVTANWDASSEPSASVAAKLKLT